MLSNYPIVEGSALISGGIGSDFSHSDFAQSYTFKLPLAERAEITEFFNFSLRTLWAL